MVCYSARLAVTHTFDASGLVVYLGFAACGNDRPRQRRCRLFAHRYRWRRIVSDGARVGGGLTGACLLAHAVLLAVVEASLVDEEGADGQSSIHHLLSVPQS